MAYIDQITLGQDATFQKRVKEAALTAATQIYTELPTAKTPLRIRYATLVLNQQVNFQAIVDAVCTNAVITAASLDSDIQFQVNAVWNALAGA